MLTSALRRLALLAPPALVPADGASEELERALVLLGWAVEGPTVVRAGYGAGLLAAVLGVPLAAVAPGGFRAGAAAAGVALSLGTAHAVHRVPAWLAAARRSRALGAAPGLVGRCVLRMHVAPAAEAAAAFAAETGEGPLADSLAVHVRRARGTPRSGLGAFADRWHGTLPGLRRSVHLLLAAGDAPPGERGRTLDRALSAVLSGTRDALASFAAAVRGPATAIYAFGVLLPLALVAVLPAAGAAGVPVGMAVVVAVYDLLLPAALAVAGGWLLVRRPVAFPPPRVPPDHPDLPDWRRYAPVAGLAAAGGTALGAGLVLPGWTVPVAAAGAGPGTALVVRYRPVGRVRRRARAVESGLPDALSLVGRRVGEGASVESAVERAADEVPGATGAVLAAAARRQRDLRIGVREAFLGERGPLDAVASPRARGTAALLALAAGEGRPAGGAVTAMADHLAALQRVERRATRDLAQVTGTLDSTATAFGPLVAGATVALADGVRTAATGGGETVGAAPPTAALGTAVGAYVLLLAVLLSALAAGLGRGLDPALVGYRAGVALLSATGVYLGAFAAAGTLV